MDDEHLIADQQSELDQPEQQQSEEGQSEGQLDGGLALALAAWPAHFTWSVMCFMTVSSSLPMTSV